jgi:hypothetical protein
MTKHSPLLSVSLPQGFGASATSCFGGFVLLSGFARSVPMLHRDSENRARGSVSHFARASAGDRHRVRGNTKGHSSYTRDPSPSQMFRPCGRTNDEVEKGRMMRHLLEIGDFVRRMRIHTRFGDLSRARLQLLHFALRGDEAECNFLARPADAWDADLPSRVSERNVSVQALRDAISVRSLLFRILPDISKAVLRVYRMSGESIELIITGVVKREEQAPATVRSLTMRAKLCGLQFWLDDGILESLQPEECLAGV